MAKSKTKKLWLSLIIPDCHIPFHNRRAYKLMINVASYFYKQGLLKDILILGDYGDTYFGSQHGPKHPLMAHTVQEEIDEVNKHLDELDIKFPKCTKTYIEGNHENRFERIILNKLAEFFGVTSIKHLFKIDQRINWTWIEYSKRQLYKIKGTKLFARHEPVGSSPTATLSKAKMNLIHGHTHKITEAHSRGLSADSGNVCASFGWLGEERNELVFGYCRPDWQLGFGLNYVDYNGYFHIEKVQIHKIGNKYFCVAGGKYFEVT